MSAAVNLSDWLTRIESLHPIKWDLGLARVGEVAERLAVIKPAPLVFLVAGTNGKGSTCEYLAAFCQRKGLSTGKTTSPHLLCFNERIVINDDMASDDELCAAFTKIDEVRGDISLSYFEFAALAALIIFKEQAVDVAILEIGLGGRLDAMNIVDPDVSIITQIALDHQSWLGDTLNKIAFEKAGVMRGGKPCVVADWSPPESIYSSALSREAKLLLAGREFGFDNGRAWYTSSEGELVNLEYSSDGHLPLPSAAAAVQALACVGLTFKFPDLEEILEATRLPGRLQWLDGDRRTLLDVAHNPGAAAYLKKYLQSLSGIREVHAVVGMYADKDCETIFSILDECIHHWYLTDLEEPRAATADDLSRYLSHQVMCGVSTYDKIALAYGRALEVARQEDIVLVFGSFPVVAGVLELTGSAAKNSKLSFS